MKRLWNLFFIISTINLSCVGYTKGLETASDVAEMDRVVEECLKIMNVPGAALSVIRDEKVVFSKGYGLSNVEKVLPVTTRTRFPIGSVSKPFTSCLIGKLVQESILHWDDLIADYIPYFRLKDSYTTYNLTFRDALTHVWGYYRHDAAWLNQGLSRSQMVYNLRYLNPSFPYRYTFQYQNLSYMLAAHAAECFMEKSWEELMKEKILNPLGMTQTGFDVTKLHQCKDFAIGYREKNKEIHSVANIDATTIGPAGSMNSNIEDLNKWVIALLKNDGSFLQAPIWEEIISPQVVSDSICDPQLQLSDIITMEAYGLGWYIVSYRGHKVVFHLGNIDGFSSSVVLIPSRGIGIVTLTNKDLSPMPILLSTMLMNKLLGFEPLDWTSKYKVLMELISGISTDKHADRHENTEVSHPIHSFAGIYEHPAYGKLEITINKTKLQATLNGIKLPLNHWHYNVFEVAEGADHVSFEGLKLLFKEDIYGDIKEIETAIEPMASAVTFRKQKDVKLFNKDYLDKFTGDYSYHGFGFVIKRNEGKLIVIVSGQPPQYLIPERDNIFRVESLEGYSVQFITNEAGAITSVQLTQPNKTVYTAYRY